MDVCRELIISSLVQMCFPGQKQVTCQDEALALLLHSGYTTNYLAVLSSANICVYVYIFFNLSNICRRCLNASGKGHERIAQSCCYKHSNNFFLNSDQFCFEKAVKFHCIKNTDMAYKTSVVVGVLIVPPKRNQKVNSWAVITCRCPHIHLGYQVQPFN